MSMPKLCLTNTKHPRKRSENHWEFYQGGAQGCQRNGIAAAGRSTKWIGSNDSTGSLPAKINGGCDVHQKSQWQDWDSATFEQAQHKAGNFTMCVCHSSTWSKNIVLLAWWVEVHQVSSPWESEIRLPWCCLCFCEPCWLLPKVSCCHWN